MSRKTAGFDPTQAAAARLEESALPLAAMEHFGLEAWDAKKAARMGFQSLGCLAIPYFDAGGKPIKYRGQPFLRVRYLEKPKTFDAVTGEERRYDQPAGTRPTLYLPLGEDWKALQQDRSAALVMTEGELKADSACWHGITTMGLGGVWNWRAMEDGLDFLPELEAFEWFGRNVYVLFDSDAGKNSQVLEAMRRLAGELERRGAIPHCGACPAGPGGSKRGIDDLIRDEGVPALEEALRTLVPWGLARELHGLNKEWVYVRDPGLLVHRESGQRASPEAFKNHLAASKRSWAADLKADGRTSWKAVSAAANWLSWPLRAERTAMAFEPGQAQELSDGRWNTWKGWGAEPKKGDASYFEKLVKHLFAGAEEGSEDWFWQWMAWPIQHPGVKLQTAAVLHGLKHGTGKSLVGYSLGRIYGESFGVVRQKDLHSDFNEWAEGRQLVLGDDVTGTEKRADADVLKSMITQEKVRVNAKYVPSYSVLDRCNYIFTSNQPDPFFLEDDDRRFYVHEVLADPLDDKFYTAYVDWLNDAGGSAIHYRLLKQDTRSFNPGARAFRTKARNRMLSHGRSDLGDWARRLRDDPDSVLRLGNETLPRALWSSAELLALYDPLGSRRVTANGLGRELGRAGFRQALSGDAVRIPGGQDRLWIVRDVNHWLSADAAEIRKHLEGSYGKEKKKAGKAAPKF